MGKEREGRRMGWSKEREEGWEEEEEREKGREDQDVGYGRLVTCAVTHQLVPIPACGPDLTCSALALPFSEQFFVLLLFKTAETFPQQNHYL
ncbi:hypothetical protein E2C01_036590 [Portunus trituberculatus]|uniref:Uncharacterized protein n=1 Tax=Portunus trituberculatus TaxID=210409 RepID=A0A5B7FBS5_PORTR|nr:hypothetical protein [Portunus trituberculatus]